MVMLSMIIIVNIRPLKGGKLDTPVDCGQGDHDGQSDDDDRGVDDHYCKHSPSQ